MYSHLITARLADEHRRDLRRHAQRAGLARLAQRCTPSAVRRALRHVLPAVTVSCVPCATC